MRPRTSPSPTQTRVGETPNRCALSSMSSWKAPGRIECFGVEGGQHGLRRAGQLDANLIGLIHHPTDYPLPLASPRYGSSPPVRQHLITPVSLDLKRA